MKFRGNGTIWDKDANKPLVEFTGGIVETNDEHVISILKKNGYKEVRTIQLDEENSVEAAPKEAEAPKENKVDNMESEIDLAVLGMPELVALLKPYGVNTRGLDRNQLVKLYREKSKCPPLQE